MIADKNKGRLPTSSMSRLWRVGRLLGRVGVSMAGDAVSGFLRSPQQRMRQREERLLENAARAVEALGKLKGVPMKIGQMLSLHEGLLPKEVADVLRALQQQAPPVPFQSVRALLERELGRRFDKIQRIEPVAHAAASIGQVHRAVLRGGRQVVFKVQYPEIDRVIAADMKNMKGLLKMILSLITRADLDAIWQELNQRLLEELDYRQEAANMKRMRDLWRDTPELVIPQVFTSMSSRHVLCMSYESGISPEWACSNAFGQRQRDRWGQVMFDLFLRGLFIDRYLHADPNLANFAFLKDGRLILYDFGCMKEIPPAIARGYGRLTHAVLNDRWERIPDLLSRMGVHRVDGGPVPMEMIEAYAALLGEPFSGRRPYRFGDDKAIYKRFIALGRTYWDTSMQLSFPHDLVFIDRTIGGLFGNLGKLRAAGPWRRLLAKSVARSLADAPPASVTAPGAFAVPKGSHRKTTAKR